MKSILKLSALAILLTVTSCAHHGCHGTKDKSQCSMKDGKKECCGDKGQCEMKKEETKETKTEEVKK